MLPKIKIMTIELTIPCTKEKALFSRFVSEMKKSCLRRRKVARPPIF